MMRIANKHSRFILFDRTFCSIYFNDLLFKWMPAMAWLVTFFFLHWSHCFQCITSFRWICKPLKINQCVFTQEINCKKCEQCTWSIITPVSLNNTEKIAFTFLWGSRNCVIPVPKQIHVVTQKFIDLIWTDVYTFWLATMWMVQF